MATGGAREGSGRKAHEPTEKQQAEVFALKSFGHTHEEIALHLGICTDTLEKYYREQLDTAVIRANAKIAGRLFAKAEGGDLTAMMFWLKTRGKGRWREKDKDEDKKFESLVEKLIDKISE